MKEEVKEEAEVVEEDKDSLSITLHEQSHA